MFNVSKQIAYWINSAKLDLDTAELLIRESRYTHGLFFCHLVIEKALKAHVTKATGEVPPKTHNLIYLLDLTGLEFDQHDEVFLGILMKYQLEGRYPDFNPVIPSEEIVLEYLNKTKMLLIWIERKL